MATRSQKSSRQKKDSNARYTSENIKKCGTCKFLYAGQCWDNMQVCHANNTACCNYEEIIKLP